MDLARQMETVDYICAYIDFAAAHGFNTLVLYLEGRVRTASFPYRPAEESYTLDEMARVVRQATAAGMDVVPVIPTLAHCEQFFTAPEMAHLAEERESPAQDLRTFCPSLAETYAFFANYLYELSAVFTGPNVHLGCDETWNFATCSLCRAEAERTGIGAMYTRHIQRIGEVCATLGKRLWIWDDMYEFFPEELAHIPAGTVLCHWNYNEVIEPEGARAHLANRWRYDWLAEYERLGLDVLIGAWARRGGLSNADTFTSYAQRHHVLGGLLMHWELSETYHEELMPLVAYVGERWRNPELEPAAAWAQAVESLIPGAPPALALAMRSLTQSAQIRLGKPVSRYLCGPLTGGEQTERALSHTAHALLQAASAPLALHATAARILDDMAISARQEEIFWGLRAVLPAIYDPQLPAAARPLLQQQTEQVLHALATLRTDIAPLHAQRRPCMRPENRAIADLDALIAALQPAWERLARGTQDDDWWLIVRLALPDTHGLPHLRISLLDDDGARPLATGMYKPLEQVVGCHYTVQLPFTSATPPRGVRFEVWGYGGQGISFVEAQSRAQRLYPRAVAQASGPVRDPEHILRDHTPFAYLGHQDIVTTMHHRALAEEIAIIEVLF
jgi:hypothetical protein